MIKFREHKGSLENSLRTTKEFKNIKDMEKYVLSLYDWIKAKKIVISERSIFDSRCEWNSRIVCIEVDGQDMAIGFCDLGGNE